PNTRGRHGPLAVPVGVRDQKYRRPSHRPILSGEAPPPQQEAVSTLRFMLEPAPPDEILRALADPERLAVAGALAMGPRRAAELAQQLNVPVRRVQRHLSRLTGGGAVRVETDRRHYLA